MSNTKIVVGSTNPVKIEAVRSAFAMTWPAQKWDITGISVPSGVSDQPMSDEECIVGARNRAKNALSGQDAAYAVGIEGGMQETAGAWFNCGWIVIIDQHESEGIGSTLRTITPPRMVRMIEQGIELGEVDDIIFHQHNSKQAGGHFGLLTHNLITRERAYIDGVITALIRFMQPELFS